MGAEFVECDDEVEDCYDYYNGTGDENYLSPNPEFELVSGLVLLVVGIFVVIVIAKIAGF